MLSKVTKIYRNYNKSIICLCFLPAGRSVKAKTVPKVLNIYWRLRVCSLSYMYMDGPKMVNNFFFLNLIIQGNHNHCGLRSSKNCAYTKNNTKNKHSKNIFNNKQIVFNLGCELTCTVNVIHAIVIWRKFKVTVIYVLLLLYLDACIFACAPQTFQILFSLPAHICMLTGNTVEMLWIQEKNTFE